LDAHEWGRLLEALKIVKTAKKFEVLLLLSKAECAKLAEKDVYQFKLAPI
jgi:hypothetical protein